LLSPLALLSGSLECDASTIDESSALGTHEKWDSFGHLRVMMALEEHYGIVISDETIRQFDNFKAIARRYNDLVKGQYREV
jgi:acyl carrier protein